MALPAISASPREQAQGTWPPTLAPTLCKRKIHNALTWLVGMAGFEPAASCSQISPVRSLGVAGHRPTSHLPGAMLGTRRQA